ncbi:hypothetical protein PybrP1_005668 [[Pythium] brassicae (nom. inval.)]|nr:hypothetical protein PybrP1_005668 [[Pythium] brassicae (nom. inval.)]
MVVSVQHVVEVHVVVVDGVKVYDFMNILVEWSLVMTCPTGRGVSVTDFICFNQRMDTMTAVLK